jgi:acyl phosphate:glycerol-3-phosphate acyltransferase
VRAEILWVVGGAYLLGAVPFGLILGKLWGGTDVRERGSGNIGATNVARSLGPAAGVATLVLDVAKGAAATWAGGRFLGEPTGASLAALAAILGHVFPVYLGFRGGKGVATGFGAFLLLDPPATVGAAVVFLVAVVATRRVSVGSLLGVSSLPLLLHVRGAHPSILVAGWLSCLLIVFRHRENLRRLLAGSEPRLGGGNS